MRRLAVLLSLFSLCVHGETWTRFRGPNGSGVSPDTGFPTEFGKSKNMTWRAAVRPGKSSPVLTRDRIFLTAYEQGTLYTQCFDRRSGKLLWERAEKQARQEIGNKLNHPAAPSPVTDGENVYVFFKDTGLISYDGSGKLRWKAALGPWTVSMGLGASPILVGELVVLVADQMEGSFIAAFAARNGEMRWKTAREEGEAWATPLLYTPKGGAPLVATASRGLFGLHRTDSGKRAASLEGLSPAIVSSHVLAGDTVYLHGYGNDEPPAFATRLQRLDKNGDGKLSADEYGDDPFTRSIALHMGNRDGLVTEDEWNERQKGILGHNGVLAIRLEAGKDGTPRARELWRTKKTLSGVIPSALQYDGVLYIVRNGGILMTLDAATGRIVKEARMTDAPGGYSASLVAGAGKVYAASEEGKIAVLRAGAEWEVLAVNDLDEPCFATPALSQGQIYVRTEAALYRFEERR